MEDSNKPIKILYFEDNKQDVELATRCFKKSKHHFEVEFRKSTHSLKAADYRPIDVIVLDYFLDDKEVSSNFLHFLKKDSQTSKIPVILYTGNESPILKSNVQKYERTWFLSKNNGVQALIDQILVILEMPPR